MMRSLSSAVAGLRTHQTKMDVIGNNIANVNTYGYKANRAVFADVFYQNLNRGSSPVTTLGGTNPTQIGYGSLVATIDVLQQRSGAASTDRPLDVFIGGEGFFTLQDSSGNYLYTRLGSLGFDAVGNLVDGGGNFVMGFPQNADGTPLISADGTVTADELQPIQVNPDLLQELTDITISAGGEIIGILPGNTRITLGTARPDFAGVPLVPPDSNLQGQVSLKVGALPDVAQFTGALANLVTDVQFGELSIDDGSDMVFTTTADGRMTVEVTCIDNEGNPKPVIAEGQWEDGQITLTYEGDTLMTLTIADNPNFQNGNLTITAANTVMKYELSTRDKGGNLRTSLDTAGNAGPQPLPPAADADPVTGMLEITLGDATFYFEPYKAAVVADPGATPPVTGSPASGMRNYVGNIGRIGMSEAEKINIGCIAIAKFNNQSGLEQVGGTQYVQSLNTGEVTYNKPGTNNVGGLTANYLEQSNVDVAKEFTDMITTQRGFQANTRIVTVSDEMLNELVNLKR